MILLNWDEGQQIGRMERLEKGSAYKDGEKV